MSRIVLGILSAIVLVVSSPLQGGQVAGPGQDTGLHNWTAPTFWQPSAPTEPRRARATIESLAVTPIDPGPLPFVALSPCRVADTRGFGGFSGAYGPPALGGGTVRSFPIAGQCGIPASARAVSFNFTVTNTAGQGFMGAYPQGSDYPGVSTLNYNGQQTVANAAIVPLSSSGGIDVVAGVSGFDLIIDVNGYYANPDTASSGAYDARQLAMLRWWEAAQPYVAAVPTAFPGYPWGMAFDGLYLWVAHTSGTVMRILPSANVALGPYTLAGATEAWNLAFDGVYLWATGSGSAGSGPLWKIRMSDVTVTSVPVTGVTSAYGIAFDGTSIWVGASNKLLRLNPSTGAILSTVNLTYGSPKDVIFDGKYVWVAGNNTPGTVTRVLASNPTDVTVIPSGGTYPTGLVFDGANVWIANYGSASVTKVRASDGTLLATKTVGTWPRGLAFDGVNVWAASESSQTIYKFRASTAQQVGNPIPAVTGCMKLGFDGVSVWAGGAGLAKY